MNQNNQMFKKKKKEGESLQTWVSQLNHYLIDLRQVTGSFSLTLFQLEIRDNHDHLARWENQTKHSSWHCFVNYKVLLRYQ